MRKAVLVLSAVLLATVAVPAISQKSIPPQLREVLLRAVTNEREAIARYEGFAAKAEEEGYPGAAALFRACARGESVHAKRFASLLADGGVPLPDPPAAAPAVGTTADNLRSSAGLEAGERDGIYKEGLAAARQARAESATLCFDQTRDTEVEHANLLGNATRHLEEMKVAKKYYVCPKCGYTSDLDLPFCVLCRDSSHPKAVE